MAMNQGSVWQYDGCMTVVQVGYVCKKCLKHGSKMGVWQLSQLAMYTRSVWQYDWCMAVVAVGCESRLCQEARLCLADGSTIGV